MHAQIVECTWTCVSLRLYLCVCVCACVYPMSCMQRACPGVCVCMCVCHELCTARVCVYECEKLYSDANESSYSLTPLLSPV